MSYLIRPIVSSDEFFLWEMLYQAICVPPGIEPPGRDILRRPEIERYLRGWGRTHDFGLVAVDATTSMRIGAAWWRLLTGGEKGYGYIDDETPELTVAVVPKRRQGVGTQLLGQLIDVVQHRCLSLSLSVSPANPGARLYQRLGFEIVGTCGTSIVMKWKVPVKSIPGGNRG